MPPAAARIAGAIQALLAQRADDASICPSEVARAIGGAHWRALMPEVRRIAGQLAVEGVVVLTQGDSVLDSEVPPVGAIRLRRGTRWRGQA